MNKTIYILAIIIPIVLIFTLKSEKTDQISTESSTDGSIGAADSILTIINNLEVPKSEKNVEIKIVEKVIIRDNFEIPRIEVNSKSIEVINRSFEEYDYLRDTISNLNKNYSELILKCEKLEKENDSIEILLNEEMKKMDAVKKTKAGKRILKRIQ
jgi:predicted patatin/cPLA2 family phospholipase